MGYSSNYINLMFNTCVALFMNTLVLVCLYMYYMLTFKNEKLFVWTKSCGFTADKIRTFITSLFAHGILVAAIITWITQSVEVFALNGSKIPEIGFIFIVVAVSFLVWKPMVVILELNEPKSACANHMTCILLMSAAITGCFGR